MPKLLVEFSFESKQRCLVARVALVKHKSKLNCWEFSELQVHASHGVMCVNLAVKVWHNTQIEDVQHVLES